jgi:hypothetical protein
MNEQLDREMVRCVLEKFYSKHTVDSILMGRRRPSMQKAIELNKQGLPYEIWADIKSHIVEKK